MGPRRKQSSQEACRTAVAPLLTRYCGRSTAFLQERLAGANAAFWRWALQAWEAGPSGVASTLLLALLLALLSALAVVLSITSYSLGRQVAEKVAQVIQTTGSKGRGPYTEEELEGLPKPVSRYFRYALKHGQPALRFCTLRQTGSFRLRTSPGMRSTEGWKPVKAQQYFSIANPGYVWVATIQLAPLLWIRGWDSYLEGKGHMFWKLLSAVTLVNFGGEEIDQSALARFLTEAVFFPTALLPSASLCWEPLDADSAKATLSHKGKRVSAVFHFSEEGQVTRLQTTDRPRRLDDGSHTEDKWTGYYRDYEEHDGIKRPMTMEAVWNLVGADFRYAVLHTEEISAWGDVENKRARKKR